MSRIEPLDRTDILNAEPLFKALEESMGFLPNSILAMGRRRDIMVAFAQLSQSIFGPSSRVSSDLKYMIGYISSEKAGCNYCMAHTAKNASQKGTLKEKIQAACNYQESPLFTDAEKAALQLAQNAASIPNFSSEKDFTNLEKYFDEEQVIEIMATISIYGFLNRWNNTLATDLEQEVIPFAEETLSPVGWKIGKHHSDEK